MPLEPTSPRPLSGIPILIVEDDPASARLFAALLRSEGAETHVAVDAETALIALETFPAQVVVIDLILPKMSGLLLVKQLKADPRQRDVVIVAVSVINGPHTERMALEHGCAAYVQKPIDVDAFVRTVLAHLQEEK
jgi:two-component system cell cycle response regulator DivK